MDTKQNPQQGSCSNDGLDPLFLSKIEDTVKDEHIVNTIKGCFIEHKISYCYIENHKRKDLVVLLRKYKIKTAISIKLWTAFTNNNNDYDSPQELRKNNETLKNVDIDNRYNACFGEDQLSMKYILYTLVCRYTHQYFHDKYEDIVKLLIFYYATIDMLPLIKLSLNNINWSHIEIIKSESRSNDSISKSLAIRQKAMNDFCFMALERLNNNYNDNLLQIDETEWVLIVHIVDDDGNCDIGVSFEFNDKFEYLFVATAIYLDKEEIESKHKLVGLKHNKCNNVRPFGLINIKFIDDDEMAVTQADDEDDDDIILSSLHCQSDWQSDEEPN